MADLRDLDRESLQRWLDQQLPELGRITSIDKFPGGQSNPTYRLSSGKGDFVLRRKPPGKLLKSAHAVDREFRVQQALADTPVPVSRVLALCEDPAVIGSDFYIMEYVHGRIFWDPALPDLQVAERTAVYDQMNQVLADLHDVDINAVGLSDYGYPGNYFERQIGRWSKQYRASETDPIADMDRLMQWLPAHLPEDDGAVSLIHGDYRLDNMIFAPEEPRVVAILDWELSTLGHPYADLAYQCMLWHIPAGAALRGLAGIELEGIPSEADFVALYCQRRGIAAIPNWAFYRVFSMFRLAAILQGVLKRALDGNASSDKALAYGQLTPRLAAMAVQSIEG